MGGGGLTGLAVVVDVLAVAGAVRRLVVANTVIHTESVVGIVTQHRRTLTSVLVANEGRLTHAEVRYIHEKTHELHNVLHVVSYMYGMCVLTVSLRDAIAVDAVETSVAEHTVVNLLALDSSVRIFALAGARRVTETSQHRRHHMIKGKLHM